MNFNQGKVATYLLKYTSRIDSLIIFFKSMEMSERSSSEDIIKIYNQRNESDFVKKIKDKSLKKKIQHFSTFQLEKMHSEANVEFINKKALLWINEAKNNFNLIREDLRALQLKKIKNTINEEEILKFKDKLVKAVTDLENKQYMILKAFGKHMIKNNCQIVQSLTNLMQLHYDDLTNSNSKIGKE